MRKTNGSRSWVVLVKAQRGARPVAGASYARDWSSYIRPQNFDRGINIFEHSTAAVDYTSMAPWCGTAAVAHNRKA